MGWYWKTLQNNNLGRADRQLPRLLSEWSRLTGRPRLLSDYCLDLRVDRQLPRPRWNIDCRIPSNPLGHRMTVILYSMKIIWYFSNIYLFKFINPHNLVPSPIFNPKIDLAEIFGFLNKFNISSHFSELLDFIQTDGRKNLKAWPLAFWLFHQFDRSAH